jgi:mannitol 2-dehydrogenase
VTTVLHRFSNTGVRDQIARLCIDGASKFPTFLVPTIEHQLAHDGPIACGALALAGWARYLGTVDESEQAPDAAAGQARELAAEARTAPDRFLELDGVMTPSMRESNRFRSAFVDAYRGVAEHGPLHAMAALGQR